MQGLSDRDPRALASVIAEKLRPSEFPRSSSYDMEWVLKNQMGPNVLWLAESLAAVIDLRPGMRVLDMGCGKAVSSIFLAKEFGVRVWANDLWISASENWRRIREAGVDELVFPIHAEAHSLPYAHEFFDALVSFDAYHYFGTEDLYLGQHFSPLAKPGAPIGIVVPGLVEEFDANPPEHLAAQWVEQPDFWSFHSPSWWKRHWVKSGAVDVDVADLVPNGWRHWLRWDEASLELGFVPKQFESFLPPWIDALRIDAGRNLGFTRLLAHRKT